MDAKGYDVFYRTHGANVHDDPLRFSAIAGLCKGHVLDVACGTGTLADFYNGPYTGVDISAVAVGMARDTRRTDAEFIVSSAFDLLALGARKFETVILAEFLEHIDFDTGILDVLLGMTAEGGRWIISVPNGDRVPDADHIRQFTVPELRKKFVRYGFVQFHPWEGFRERILMTVEVGAIDQLELGLCMPVKDEGKGLEHAILSVIEHVSHIQIAVDKASTDDTLAIARRYADVVREFDWTDSFCAARNIAQEGMPTRWTLALDGHEYIKSVGNLPEYLKRETQGLNVQIQMEDGMRFWFPRIIRSSVKWVKDVHNAPEIGVVPALPDFLIVHDRTNLQAEDAVKNRAEQRNRMMVKILTAAIKANKRDSRSMFYLAQHYMISGQYRRALRYCKRYLKYAKNVQERWLVRYNMAVIHLQMKHLFRAVWCLHSSDEEMPGRWETRELLGVIYFMRGDHFAASEYLVASLDEPQGRFVYNPLRHDLVRTWDFIARCLYNLRKYDEARIAFKRAIQLELARPEGERDKTRLLIMSSFLELQK